MAQAFAEATGPLAERLLGALAAACGGELAQAASFLAPLVAADRRWREAFDRYERLGILPEGVLERLAWAPGPQQCVSHKIEPWPPRPRNPTGSTSRGSTRRTS